MCKCRGRMDARERPPWVTFDRSHPWLRPCGRTKMRPILFPTKLCFGKSHQNHSPRSARQLPSYPHPTGRSTNLPGAERRASGSNTVSLESSRWVCGTRRATGCKTPPRGYLGWAAPPSPARSEAERPSEIALLGAFFTRNLSSMSTKALLYQLNAEQRSEFL